MKGLNTSGEPPAGVLSEEEEEDEEVTGVSVAGASEGQSRSSSGLPAGQRTPTAEAGVSGEEEEGGLLREIRLLESPVDLTRFSFGEDKPVEETGKRKKKKTGGAAQEVKENVTSTDLHCPFKGIEESKLSVNRKIVREYLANINEFKSPGPDELHPRVLKEIVEEILEPLSIIFENSWRTGEVPEDWRRANVVPIFKKGKKVDPGNYRPISIEIPIRDPKLYRNLIK
ncbi:uncharacterized protein [Phyllobates terribilis]|uniref:uncharacterized protein n=1 Tax=Phyllobates terribilis TaxID=111132 RepID=UPI003CCB2C36